MAVRPFLPEDPREILAYWNLLGDISPQQIETNCVKYLLQNRAEPDGLPSIFEVVTTLFAKLYLNKPSKVVISDEVKRRTFNTARNLANSISPIFALHGGESGVNAMIQAGQPNATDFLRYVSLAVQSACIRLRTEEEKA